MSALAQCDAFAFIYDQAGDPAPDVLVVLKRVLDASGNPILLSPKTTVTDSAGSFHFTLPELATAFISARASALWNCPEGRAFTVPPGPSGELVPDFSLPASTLVEPPLVYVGDVLSIPRASETQDGYLAAADFAAFEAGASEMGVTQINTGTGLTGGPITDTGTIGLATISGVAGTWSNPVSITVNAQGQIIAITAGAPDITAPIITLVTVTLITGTTATVTWHTNEPADSQVEYGPTTGYGTSSTLDTTAVLDHSVPITGLVASTLYHFRVKSKDTASNSTTSGDSTFTTTSVVDTTPPAISAVTATLITSSGATITWTTDDASDSQVEYGLTTSYGSTTTLNTSMVTSHSVPITGTTATTLYHYRVKSRNAASLLTTSGDNTFTTTAVVDTTAPVISAIASTVLSSTAVTVTWTTDDLSDSQVEYGPTTSYGTSTTLDATMVTSHSVPITGLTASTLYHFRVKSANAIPLSTTSADGTFTTAAPLDLLTGLISMWKMDETGTSTVRADSHGAHPLTPATVGSGAGVINGAVHFGGTGDRMVAPDHADLQTGPADYTWALWINLDNKAGSGQVFISKVVNNNLIDEFYISYDTTLDRIQFTTVSSGSYQHVTAESFGSPALGQWYFLVCSHNVTDSSISISVNDGPVDIFTPVPPLNSGSSELVFGSYGNGISAYMAGYIDEAAFWKTRFLPAPEITWLYNSGAGRAFSTWP